MAESTFNTKLRNPGVRPGSYWVSPRAISWVWGCRPPSLVMLSSISRRLFQEPCTLGGHLAGSFPPFLHPSPPIFKPFFRLYFPHKANKTKQKKCYTAARPPPPPGLLDSLPSVSPPSALLSLLASSSFLTCPLRAPPLPHSSTTPVLRPRPSPLSPYYKRNTTLPTRPLVAPLSPLHLRPPFVLLLPSGLPSFPAPLLRACLPSSYTLRPLLSLLFLFFFFPFFFLLVLRGARVLVRQVQQRPPVCSQRNMCVVRSGEFPQPCMCLFGGRYLGLRDHSGQCFGAGSGVEDGR
jgi:hypothetical protein